MNPRILVVDDDPQITSLLERYLGSQGFMAMSAASGREMREVLQATPDVDLCVLDVGLPDADGFELTRELRKTSDIPVIVLSVRTETYDKVLGLEFGADDYVTKPFEPRELVARIRTVLRRTKREALAQHQLAPGQTILRFGEWVMNIATRSVFHNQTKMDPGLTSTEFDMLRAFVEQPRTVLTRDRLLDLARGPSACVSDRAVDVHIMRLRKKLEHDPAHPSLIKTIHGAGYCLADDVTRYSGEK
ncbi:MAG: response regulator transcription factor [Filomicrobium sp.]